MKKVFSLALTILVCVFGVCGYVKAEGCDANAKRELGKLASKMSSTYEFVYDDSGNVLGFNLIIYNIPDDMVVHYTTTKYNISGALQIEKGTGKVFDSNLDKIYSYIFDVYVANDNCNYRVKTLSIGKPKYNSYSESPYCSLSEIKDTVYCEEWITRDFSMNSEEIERVMKSYIKHKTTTTGTTKCVDCGVEGISSIFNNFYKKYRVTILLSIFLGIILDVIAMVLMAKKEKEGEL